MSTAITSSTSTSTELAALPGKSENRGAAKAAQVASARPAPIAPSNTRGMAAPVRLNRGRSNASSLAPEDAVHLRAHKSRKSQAGAHQAFPVVMPHLAATAPGAAGAGKLVIEGEAGGPVVHTDFFAGRDRLQRNDRVPSVIAEVRITAVVDEVHRMAHRLGFEGAGDFIEGGVVSVADERAAQRRRELLELRGCQNREGTRLLLVDPVILAEQGGTAPDRMTGKQPTPDPGVAHLE